MLHKTRLIAAVAILAVVIGVRAADKPPAGDQLFDDATFVKMAAIDGMHEVELGKIGAAQAKNDDVKKFAEMMVKDHGKADEELKAAAKAANIAVPDKIDDKHQKHIDHFKNYMGTNFDDDYMKHMVADHTEVVALFTRASKEAKNKELKDFATRTLPVIQGHLEQAKKLSK
jgi:putative membrane protein